MQVKANYAVALFVVAGQKVIISTNREATAWTSLTKCSN